MTDMFGPDDPGDLPEGPPDFWAGRWEDTGEPVWWNENVRIYGEIDGQLMAFDYTAADWYNEVTTRYSEELEDMYGVDNLDIIRQLEDRGVWGEELGFYYDEEGELHEYSLDWAYWREQYEGA